MNNFYVTLTWHDWPEGGSYGTVVDAESYAQAEELARAEMRAIYTEDSDGYEDQWHLVDCFKVEDFPKHKEALRLLDSLLDRNDVLVDSAAADVIEEITELLR